MKKVHLVIADLFLPQEVAASTGLALPYLEKLLSRAKRVAGPAVSIEEILCGMFGVPSVAAASAAFDGLEPGRWLRADPVHVRLQREQVVLLPNVAISSGEARQFCASLNEHFADQGVEFFAPHPERWYVKMHELPEIVTVPLSQVAGRNIHGNLPSGAGGRRLQQIFNEIQMLLHAHPVNELREARQDVPINSVWLWGNEGRKVSAQSDFCSAASDDVLVEMLAASVSVPFSAWQPVWNEDAGLLVWAGLRSALRRGDLGAWRDALQDFEKGYARPLWQALRSGDITQLQLDIIGGDSLHRFSLTRSDAWAFWRQAGKLSDYSVDATRG